MPRSGYCLLADVVCGFGQQLQLHLRLLWCRIVVSLELCCQLV